VSDAAIEQLVALSEQEVPRGEIPALELSLADAVACIASAVYQGRADRDLSSVENLVVAHSVLDLDDVDWVTVHHPGSVVIPTVLATAHEVGCSGSQLTTALSVGYRVSAGVAAMLDPTMRSRWHATAVCGAFGAGAAAALLRGADAETLARTMALVASSVGGLAAAPRARNGAAVFTRVAAASLGLLAARCAERRLPFAPDIVSGPGGFAEVFALAPARSISDVRGVGSASLRLFPVTGFAHAAVWTAGIALEEDDEIEKLQVSVSEATALVAGNETWWNVGLAVGRSFAARDPFACDRESGLQPLVVVQGSKLPLDRAVVTVHMMNGSRVELSGATPGRMDEDSTSELFERKAHEVLAVSGQQARSNAVTLMRSGVAAGEDVLGWLPSPTSR